MLTNLNLACYTCDELLSRKETFYLYQCHTCINKTSYCQKCNKTMDNLLNGLFFKCFYCKVLTKITNRESVSPENKNFNNMIFQGTPEFDREIKCLFQQNINVENNTPMKNLFNEGVFNPNSIRTVNNFNVPHQNLIASHNQPINQNLIDNFNRTEVNNFNQLIQTPKSNGKMDKTLIFSPDERLKTPLTSRHGTASDKPINLRELGLTSTTPRNISRNNNSHPDEFSIQDFEKKLLIQGSGQGGQNNNINNVSISNNYSLLASKNSRTCRQSGRSNGNDNSSINSLLSSKKTSVFAGYNKTEPSKNVSKNVSKSPLSLRKSKPKFGFPGGVVSSNHTNNNNNNNNISSTNQSFLLSNDRLNSSFTNYNNESIHQPQKFGISAYLSDIKPVHNYNTHINTTRFSFNDNNNNFLKLTNLNNTTNNI